jgi:choline dehydrogenase
VTLILAFAGDDNNLFCYYTPAMMFDSQLTENDWNFVSSHQPGLLTQGMLLPRGRVLGGCSTTNAMLYVRGHSASYDGWAKAGCDGWSYADLLPFFRKFECVESTLRDGEQYRGESGSLAVTFPVDVNPTTVRFLRACQEAGLAHVPDYNGRWGVAVCGLVLRARARNAPGDVM